jgi:uroporphyrin-III C-methyltransferase/precorrin-2 dehydrogenase/sirohydrochlorin ferrochelatase
VPGVTSAISVPAAAGIPVTHRGVAHEFSVVSGHVPPDHPTSLVDWDALARMRGTVVLLMAVGNLPAIAGRLVAGGRAATTPVAVVAEGTMPGERTVWSTLEEVAADVEREDVRPPAIVVVGEVVAVGNPERYPWLS